MKSQPVTGAALLLSLLSLLGPACSEKDGLVEDDPVLNVPEDYATPQAAAAAAEAGDKIVVRYREAEYVGDLELPAGVWLIGHVDNPLLPRLRGQLRVVGGDAETRISGFHLENPDGSGLVLENSACTIDGLWIEGCAGAGVELVGDSPARVQGCDIEACAPGILIRDTTRGGHYSDAEAPAARIVDCNFIGNGPLGDFDNLVFSNIPLFYTVYVETNYWGEGVSGVAGIDATITDNKDDPAIKGIAFTEPENASDLFIWMPALISHWWQE